MLNRTRAAIVATASWASPPIGGGVALAAGGGDDARDRHADLRRPSSSRPAHAALEHTGEGRVTETEKGDEESLYEVEVTLDDGSQVDVPARRGLQGRQRRAATRDTGEDDVIARGRWVRHRWRHPAPLFPRCIHSVYSRRREHPQHAARAAGTRPDPRLRAEAGLRPALRVRQAAQVRPGVRHAGPPRARRPHRGVRRRARLGPRPQALRHHARRRDRARPVAGRARGPRAPPPVGAVRQGGPRPAVGATGRPVPRRPARRPPGPHARAHRRSPGRRPRAGRCSPTTRCSTSRPTCAGSTSPSPGSTSSPRR